MRDPVIPFVPDLEALYFQSSMMILELSRRKISKAGVTVQAPFSLLRKLMERS